MSGRLQEAITLQSGPLQGARGGHCSVHMPPGSHFPLAEFHLTVGLCMYALLWGIFPTQESNPCLLCSPALVGRLFTTSATWEAPILGVTLRIFSPWQPLKKKIPLCNSLAFQVMT